MPPDQKHFTLHRYDFDSYDKHCCLKPPFLLWLAVLYLARAFVLPFMAGVASASGSSDLTSLTRGQFQWVDFVPVTVALLVPLTFLMRAPAAPALIRGLWTRGRVLMATASLLDFGVCVTAFGDLNDISGVSLRQAGLLLACAIDLAIVAYMIRSRRVRDAFSDFPHRSDQPKRS